MLELEGEALPHPRIVKATTGAQWQRIHLLIQEMRETQVRSLGQEDALENEMATTPVSLSGKFHGRRSLADCSPWGCKESDMTEHVST